MLYFDSSNDGIIEQKTKPSKITPIAIKNIDSILDSFLFINCSLITSKYYNIHKIHQFEYQLLIELIYCFFQNP